MERVYQVIHLHTDAPAKPRMGAACNGCGVCCASERCPLGLLAPHDGGPACSALTWSAVQGRYLCGFVGEAARHLRGPLRLVAPLVARAARRLIASGEGCDCSLEVGPG